MRDRKLEYGISLTIVPWVLIFGMVVVMLNVYPGWISPFSNTFGYGLTKLAGSKFTESDIPPPQGLNNSINQLKLKTLNNL